MTDCLILCINWTAMDCIRNCLGADIFNKKGKTLIHFWYKSTRSKAETCMSKICHCQAYSWFEKLGGSVLSATWQLLADTNLLEEINSNQTSSTMLWCKPLGMKCSSLNSPFHTDDQNLLSLGTTGYSKTKKKKLSKLKNQAPAILVVYFLG
jgi:hypothetical protein